MPQYVLAVAMVLVATAGCTASPQVLLEQGIRAELEHQAVYAPKRRGEAAELYERACQGGLEHACFFFERLMVPSRPSVAEFRRRRAQYKPDCDRGDGRACFMWGMAFDDNGGVGVDVVRAITLYDRACELGYSYACQRAAALHYVVSGSEISVVDTRALTMRSCEAGYGRACLVAANLVKAGHGGPRDVPRSRELLGVACRRGQAEACVRLAKRHVWRDRNGLEPGAAAKARPELTALAAPLEVGCRLGHGPACELAAGLAMQSLPVPDNKRAVQLLEAGCDAGLEGACMQLAHGIDAGKLKASGKPRKGNVLRLQKLGRAALDKKRAHAPALRAAGCAAGLPEACRQAARADRRPGETASQRWERTQSLRDRATALVREAQDFWFDYYQGRCFKDGTLSGCQHLVEKAAMFGTDAARRAVRRRAQREAKRLFTVEAHGRAKAYRLGCEADDAFACVQLSNLVRSGALGTPRPAEAVRLRAKSERLVRELRQRWRQEQRSGN